MKLVFFLYKKKKQFCIQQFVFKKKEMKCVTKKKSQKKQLDDLIFCYKVCKYVKSNAIVLAKNKTTVGIGAGQMSRIDSTKISLSKISLENKKRGFVAASDAFFPFSDSLEIAAENGVIGVVQPGGSIKDDEIIDAANKLNLFMIFTNERHFVH